MRLNKQEMLDLAAYYAYLPRQPGPHPDVGVVMPQIVARRAPMRNVAACLLCHGTADAKLGTPLLDGQSAVYLKGQLQAFASGTRRNDISEQMRNVARQMTAAEIGKLRITMQVDPESDVPTALGYLQRLKMFCRELNSCRFNRSVGSLQYAAIP